MRSALALLLALSATGPAAAEAVVSYGPSDAPVSSLEYRSASERDAVYRSMAALLKRLGKDLPAGRKVEIELLAIRPAGRLDPFWPSAGQVRIVSGITPPSVRLRYAVTERGRRIAGGEETVTDMNYLDDVSARTSLASFPYETALLKDWFRDRVRKLRPAR